MPVPKRRTSKQRKNNRRSHHSLKITGLVKDKVTGLLRRSHRVCKQTGTYKNKDIIKVD